MKKLFLMMTAATFMMVALIGCKGGPSGDPKAVTKAFFEALKAKDFDGAAKYATKESKAALDMMKNLLNMAKTMGKGENTDDMDFDKEWKGKKIEYSEPKIDGDNATVSLMADGKEQMPISLKKEDGTWKVAFDKNTLMQQGMKKMSEGGKDVPRMEDLNGMTDSMKKAMENVGPAMDSLKKAMEEAGPAMDSLKKVMQQIQ